MGVAPDGTEFTIQDANGNNNDDIDSDVDASGMSGVVSVTAGGVTDVDLGVCEKPLGTLSGRYFCDENRDDIDNGESAVPGAQVQLFLINDANQLVFVADTTTDADGNYIFRDLAEGVYQVGFQLPGDITGSNGGTPFADKTFVAPNVGNDQDDSDVVDTVQRLGVIEPVTLDAGEDVTDVDAGIVVPNVAPLADDAAGKGCANELISVDFSAAYSDADSASVAITEINGVAITAGGPAVTLANGVEVSLSDQDVFVFNGETAYESLDIGDMSTENFVVTVEDSDGATATGSIDVTFCGVAETLDELYASFPTQANYQVQTDNIELPIEGSAFDLRISGTGDARFDGQTFETAYCLSIFDPALGTEDFLTAPLNSGRFTDGNDGSVFNDLPQPQVSIANGQAAADNMDLTN